jgi:hypothetical protein
MRKLSGSKRIFQDLFAAEPVVSYLAALEAHQFTSDSTGGKSEFVDVRFRACEQVVQCSELVLADREPSFGSKLLSSSRNIWATASPKERPDQRFFSYARPTCCVMCPFRSGYNNNHPRQH